MQLNSLFTFLGMNASSKADVDPHAAAQEKTSGFGAMLASTLAMLSQKSGSDTASASSLPDPNTGSDPDVAEDPASTLTGLFVATDSEASSGGTDIPNTGPSADEDAEAESAELAARQKSSEDIGPLRAPSTETGVDEHHRHVAQTGNGDGADDELLKRSAGSGSNAGNDQISEERLARHERNESGTPRVPPDGSAEQTTDTAPVDLKVLMEEPSATPDAAQADETASIESGGAPLPSDADLGAREQAAAPTDDTAVGKRRGSAPVADRPSTDAPAAETSAPAGDDDPAVGNRQLQGSEASNPTSDSFEDAKANGIQPPNEASDDILRPNTSSSDAPTDEVVKRRGTKSKTVPGTHAAPPDPEVRGDDSTTPSKFAEQADSNPVDVQRDTGRSSREKSAAESGGRTAAGIRQNGTPAEAVRQHAAEQPDRLRVADLERALHGRISIRQEPSTISSPDVETAVSSSARADIQAKLAIPADVDAGSEAAKITTSAAAADAPEPDTTIQTAADPKTTSKTDGASYTTVDGKIGANAAQESASTSTATRSAPQNDPGKSAEKSGAAQEAATAATESHLTETGKTTADVRTSTASATANVAVDNSEGESHLEGDRSSSQPASGEKANSGNTATGNGGAQNDSKGGSNTQPDDAFDIAADALRPDALEFEAALQDEAVAVDAEVSVDVQSPESTEKLNFTPDRTQSTATSTSNPLAEADRTARPRQPGNLNWMRAMLQDGLSELSLEDDWKVLEMKLDEGQGTMTVRARRDEDKVTISVNFTDSHLRALATEQADRLQETLRAQYATQVDFSLMNDNAGHSQQQQNQASSGGDRSVDDSSPLRTHSVSGADRARATRAALIGASNEWIG